MWWECCFTEQPTQGDIILIVLFIVTIVGLLWGRVVSLFGYPKQWVCSHSWERLTTRTYVMTCSHIQSKMLCKCRPFICIKCRKYITKPDPNELKIARTISHEAMQNALRRLRDK